MPLQELNAELAEMLRGVLFSREDHIVLNDDFWIEIDERTAPGTPVADRIRIFARDDGAGNSQLCFIDSAGVVTCSGGGVAAPHDILSATHTDAAVQAVTEGSLIYGDATPDWNELVVGGAHQLLKVNAGATQPAWSSFDWDEINAAAGADMVHDHSNAAEGGTLPAASLPDHTHSGAGQGGSLVVGTTDTDATLGSVFFAGTAGVIQEDNANLFWDSANDYLGVRTNSPGALVDAEDLALDITTSRYGVRAQLTKTAGVTDQNDDLYAGYFSAEMDDTDSTIGNVVGVYGEGILTAGTVGDVVEVLAGGEFSSLLTSGTVGSDQVGVNALATVNGGTIDDDLAGVWIDVDGNTGTVSDDVFGLYCNVVLDNTMTLGRNVYGAYISTRATSSPAGTGYGIYVRETGNIDYTAYLYSSVSGHPVLQLENQLVDEFGPRIVFYMNSGTPADDDELGRVDFLGETSTAAQERYASIVGYSEDVTNGDTAGSLFFEVTMNATERNLLEISGYNGSVNQGEVIINQDGQDVDFRVEGSGASSALVVVGSSGKIGMGTTTVPHGGIGAALLSLEGANSNTTGPHIQTTTDSDDYPIIQLLSWSHDNSALVFDAFWDGSWKSSDLGSNFMMRKINDRIALQYDSGVAVDDATVIVWNDGIVLDTSGRVGVGAIPAVAGLSVDSNSNSNCLRLFGQDETNEIADLYLTSTRDLVISTIAGGGNGFIDLRTEDANFGIVIRESDGTSSTTPFANLHVTAAAANYLHICVDHNTGASTGLIVTENDQVGIGITAPATSALLDLTSTTGALLVPRMTTAQRGALTAVNGMIIYNSSTNAFNFYENSAWVTGSGLA